MNTGSHKKTQQFISVSYDSKHHRNWKLEIAKYSDSGFILGLLGLCIF